MARIDQAQGTTPLEVAKWLLPSISALFALVGYVAALGHFSLLGFDPGFLGATQYGAFSASFMLDTLLSFLNGDAWVAVFTTLRLAAPVILSLLIACVFAFHKNSNAPIKFFKSSPISSISIFLAFLIFLKIIAFDFPLEKIQGALITQTTTIGEAAFSLDKNLSKAAKAATWANFPARQADALWKNMLCSRAGTHFTQSEISTKHDTPKEDVSKKGAVCMGSPADHAARVVAEFIAGSMVAAAIVWVSSILLLRARQTWALSLAWLALLYCLTVPYSYGKLIYSSEYEYGTIALKTQKDLAKGDSTQQAMTGFFLLNKDNYSVIATLVDSRCFGGVDQQVKIWKISNSEIMWHREIYRDDIIGWKIAKETDTCSDSGL